MAAPATTGLLISVSEAARLLGIGKNRAYTWCHRGLLPHARDGSRIYVPRRSVEALVDKIERGEFDPGVADRLVPAGRTPAVRW